MGEVRAVKWESAVKWEKSLSFRVSTEELIRRAANSVEIGYNPNKKSEVK